MIDITCPNVPAQAEGQLFNGTFWYFRARHGSWRFGTGDNHYDSVSPWATDFAGDDPTEGWMSEAWLVNLVQRSIRALLDGEAPGARDWAENAGQAAWEILQREGP